MIRRPCASEYECTDEEAGTVERTRLHLALCCARLRNSAIYVKESRNGYKGSGTCVDATGSQRIRSCYVLSERIEQRATISGSHCVKGPA